MQILRPLTPGTEEWTTGRTEAGCHWHDYIVGPHTTMKHLTDFTGEILPKAGGWFRHWIAWLHRSLAWRRTKAFIILKCFQAAHDVTTAFTIAASTTGAAVSQQNYLGMTAEVTSPAKLLDGPGDLHRLSVPEGAPR